MLRFMLSYWLDLTISYNLKTQNAFIPTITQKTKLNMVVLGQGLEHTVVVNMSYHNIRETRDLFPPTLQLKQNENRSINS